MNDEERRQALADFLRTRRARLSPADVGLPLRSRRRTPGLRREEVAELANIGTSWYISLEQGRDIHPSEQVLESLAQALKLSPDERQHLFLLALQHIPMREVPAEEQVSPALQQVVKSLDPHPAYILGRRWDVLAHNRAAEYLFSFDSISPPHTRNMLWRIFTSPARYRLYADEQRREYVARGLIAQFRADYARYPGDPWFAELISDLQQASEQFRLWWSQHDVSSVPDCHKEMKHPTLGHLEFEMVTLQVPTHPDQKMLIYTASSATVAKLERLLLPTSDEFALAQ
ncbi:MAG TPA: helix-turn-helix transcriptional regulator [Ktedonobacteraceae bacterium]|nr:helix-turn-helix transcriptional regulator [Ktedonobacteraceae bacterium]